MKKSKLIMLDEELFEDLKSSGNASALINELVSDYFSQPGHVNIIKLKQDLQKKNNQIFDLNLEIKGIQEQIDELEVYNNRVKEVFKNIPMEILNDFKDFPKLTIESLKQRYDNIYSIKFNISWEELRKVFEKSKEIKK